MNSVNNHTLYEKRTIDLAFNLLSDHFDRYHLAQALMKNPSANIPYHNNFHTATMILNCFDGLKAEKESWNTDLIVAATFHDYNHSGGTETDDKNILRAVKGFDSWVRRQTTMPTEQRKQIREMIRVTQYPYIREPKTIEEAIIRDADLMTMYEDNWYKMIFVGLRQELEIARKTSISVTDMALGMVDFMADIKWHTSWAQEKAKAGWWLAEHRIAQVLKYQNIFEAS